MRGAVGIITERIVRIRMRIRIRLAIGTTKARTLQPDHPRSLHLKTPTTIREGGRKN